MGAMQSILNGKARAVYEIAPDATAYDAVEEMCRLQIGALLVVEGETPIGIVSERDILTRVLLKRKRPEQTLVAEVMTTDVACIDADAEPEEAMSVMTERRCRHLPVMRGNLLVGIVSIGDLVRWASEARDFEIRVLKEYVTGIYPG